MVMGAFYCIESLYKQGIDEKTLTPLQRLSIVRSVGMGALCYVPSTLVVSAVQEENLGRLQQSALALLAEKTDADAELLFFFRSGNSGGCRQNARCGMWKANGL